MAEQCFASGIDRRKLYARRSIVGSVESEPPDISWDDGRHCSCIHCRAHAAKVESTAGQEGSPAPISDGPNIEGAVPVTLRINGKDHQLRVDPRTTLLDCLRETVHLTGTKKGCDHGQCGACTVHVNGRRVNSCLSLALDARRRRDHHHRGPRHTRRTASNASRVRCLRRIPMWLLHVRADHVGGGAAQGTLRSRRCGREGTDERQHLPLRGVSRISWPRSSKFAKTLSRAERTL